MVTYRSQEVLEKYFHFLLLSSRRDAILILETFIGKVCLYMFAQLFSYF